MNTSAYNDYVLTASLQVHWISQEEKQSVETALQRLPGMAALDLMLDQGMLSEEQGDMLRSLIAENENQSQFIPTSDSITGLPYNLHDFLLKAINSGASDIHLGPDAPILVRLNGQLTPLIRELPLLTAKQTKELACQFLSPEQQQEVESKGVIETAYDQPGLGRFRCSVVRQHHGWESVFRVINTHIPTLQELGFPAAVANLVQHQHGLILVTGPAGSGKSTTLAAMVQAINQQRHDHIIMLEDPIEQVFTGINCRITQREIGKHSKSFATALRAALRQDPDVIVIGELRDKETISLAITAAETGHLVIGTMHTGSAARTLQRLLNVFPAEQQPQIRTTVSESLRGIICQQLIPRFDGQGRVLAAELMLNTPAIANLIREDQSFLLPGQIQISQNEGMILMDQTLLNLVDQQLISPEEAFERCEDRQTFAQQLAERMRNL